MWPWTSRWWLGFWATPRRPSSSGSTAAVAPSSSSSSSPRTGSGPLTSSRSSANWRSPAGSPARSAGSGRAPPCPVELEAELGAEAGRAQDAQRVGGEAPVRDGAQDALARGRRSPAVRVDRLGLRVGERHGDRVDGEVALVEVRGDRFAAQPADVHVPAAVRPRAPARSRTPPRARTPARPRASAMRRAAAAGSPATARSRSTTPRAAQGVAHRAARRSTRRRRPRAPRRRDRHRAARPRSASATGAHRVRDELARHPGRDPAGDLVVDRPEPLGELLGQDPLVALGADQHRRRPRPRRRSPPRGRW